MKVSGGRSSLALQKDGAEEEKVDERVETEVMEGSIPDSSKREGQVATSLSPLIVEN